ncbi:hypothetical protein WA158_001645 [Blastocystis sp. Blastoise]
MSLRRLFSKKNKDGQSFTEDAFTDSKKQFVYKIIRELGKGSYGRVCLCEHDTGSEKKQFAVKIFSKSFLRNEKRIEKIGKKTVFSNALEQVEREFALMKKLNHPNIVKLIDVIDDPDEDRLYMVLEFVENGQIMYSNAAQHMYYSKQTNSVLPEDTARQYFRDIIAGLKYLHEHGVVHRDIKPENILLTKDNHSHLFTNLCHGSTIEAVNTTKETDIIAPAGIPDTSESHIKVSKKNTTSSISKVIGQKFNSSELLETADDEDDVDPDYPYFADKYNNDINRLSSYEDSRFDIQVMRLQSLNAHNSPSYSSSSEDLNFFLNPLNNESSLPSSISRNITNNKYTKTPTDNALDANNISLSSSDSSPLQEISASLSDITRIDAGDLKNTAGTMYYMPPERLLEKDPAKRITIPEIISHPWFTESGEFRLSTSPSVPNMRSNLSRDDIKRAFTPSARFIIKDGNFEEVPLNSVSSIEPIKEISASEIRQDMEEIQIKEKPAKRKKCTIM